MAGVISMKSKRLFPLTHEATAWTVTGAKKIVLLVVPDFAELHVACFLRMLLARYLTTSDPSTFWNIAPKDEPISVCVVVCTIQFLKQLLSFGDDTIVICRPDCTVNLWR